MKTYPYDPFSKKIYNLNLDPKLSDSIVLVDPDQFQLIPYIKYLMDPRIVIL